MFLRHALAIAVLFFALSTFAQCEYTEVNFTTTTALYPWETGWELYQVGENEATLIVSFQGSIEGTFSTQTCLEDGCYYFLATDSWGDGCRGAFSPGAIVTALQSRGMKRLRAREAHAHLADLLRGC